MEFPEILNRSLPNKGWRPGTTSTTIGWSYKVLGSSAERRFNVSTPRHGARFSRTSPRWITTDTKQMNWWTRCISCCEEIQRHIHFFNWLGICYKLQCSMDQLSVPLESPCVSSAVSFSFLFDANFHCFWRQSLQTSLFVSRMPQNNLGEAFGSCDVSSCFGNRSLQISVGTGIWIYHIYGVQVLECINETMTSCISASTWSINKKIAKWQMIFRQKRLFISVCLSWLMKH